MEGDAGADEASGAGLSFWDAVSKGEHLGPEVALQVGAVRKEAHGHGHKLELATEARRPSKGQGLR